MNCANCGKPLTPNARFCPSCGTSTISAKQPEKEGEQRGIRSSPRDNLVPARNPPLPPHVALLSLLIPGLGQIVLGQTVKGIIALAGLIVLEVFVASAVGPGALAIWFLVAILYVADGYMVGGALRKGKPVRKLQWFPA
jgi:hypothetical protein